MTAIIISFFAGCTVGFLVCAIFAASPRDEAGMP